MLKIKDNPDTYLLRCPCNLAHIAASNAHDEFAKITGISAEELLVELYYWFEKSTKLKGILVEQHAVLQPGMWSWSILLLGDFHYSGAFNAQLRSVLDWSHTFLSEDVADTKCKRLHTAFENPPTEIAQFFTMFQSHCLWISTNFCSQMSHQLTVANWADGIITLTLLSWCAVKCISMGCLLCLRHFRSLWLLKIMLLFFWNWSRCVEEITVF